MRKVLITGGTGFLGSNLTKKIIDEVESITIATTDIRQKTTLKSLGVDMNKINLVKGDIRDFDFIRLLFNEYEFDTVFHLAAISEVIKCQSDPKLAYDVNIGGTINILECARAYGNVEAINNIRKILNGERPVIWKGSEKSTREFLYIDDAVDAYVSLVKNIDKTKGNAYNVGSGEKVTIGELLELLLDSMDSDLTIDYVEKDIPEITHQYLDSNKIKNDTGWDAEVCLSVGLKESVKAYKEIL